MVKLVMKKMMMMMMMTMMRRWMRERKGGGGGEGPLIVDGLEERGIKRMNRFARLSNKAASTCEDNAERDSHTVVAV